MNICPKGHRSEPGIGVLLSIGGVSTERCPECWALWICANVPEIHPVPDVFDEDHPPPVDPTRAQLKPQPPIYGRQRFG